MRRGEALRLTRADVDLRTALLTVRQTKFDKTRYVPLAPQLSRAMQEYAAQRQAAGAPQAGEAPFFANRDGTPLAARTVSNAFARLRQAAGVVRGNSARYQPRLHDPAPLVRRAPTDRLAPPGKGCSTPAAAAVHLLGPLQRRRHPSLPRPDSRTAAGGRVAVPALRGQREWRPP